MSVYIDVVKGTDSNPDASFARVIPDGTKTDRISNFKILEGYRFSRSDLEMRMVTELEKENSKICHGAVSHTFALEEIPSNKWLMTIHDDNKFPDQICGFVLADPIEEYGQHGIYLDVICSQSGYGVLLMDCFVRECEKENIDFIKLSSLSNVLSFYPRYNFEHRKSCYPGAQKIAMPDSVKKFMIENKDPILTNINFLFGFDEFQNFIMGLHGAGYSTRKSKCSRRITYKQFIRNKCYEDGFAMRRCYKDLVRTPPSSKTSPKTPPPSPKIPAPIAVSTRETRRMTAARQDKAAKASKAAKAAAKTLASRRAITRRAAPIASASILGRRKRPENNYNNNKTVRNLKRSKPLISKKK
jgi:hypothetical protein